MTSTLADISEALFGEGGVCDVGCSEEEAWEISRRLLSMPGKKRVRIVGNWVWLDVQAKDAEVAEMDRAGVMPSLIYAHRLISDSANELVRGGWVCTTLLLKESCPGYVVETRNSTYILVGQGHRRSVMPGAVLSILNGASLL